MNNLCIKYVHFIVLTILLFVTIVYVCSINNFPGRGLLKKTIKNLIMATANESGITAYSVKTKTKNVPIIDPVIDVKAGRYIATGLDKDGNKLAAILGKAKAEEHVSKGTAKKGSGW